MASRNYSETTIKSLFGKSRNRCAYPKCENRIIEITADTSSSVITGFICHIYAAADKGPRPNPKMSEKERNDESNLLLLCGHHHTLVDKAEHEFPAETLLRWKNEHEAQSDEWTAETQKRQESLQQGAFLQAASDEEIERQVERIRKYRHLAGFNVADETLALAGRVAMTQLTGGSPEVRARALAWCARFLSTREHAEQARQLLEDSKALALTAEATIAEAFMEGSADPNRGLTLLTSVSSPAANTAALCIITKCKTPSEAVSWVKQAGLKIGDFDADGKLVHLMNLVRNHDWADLTNATAAITDNDLEQTPTLLQPLAMEALAQAVPAEFRNSALWQVPMSAAFFPLSATDDAIEARTRAIDYFERLSAFSVSAGVTGPANPASDHALWLRLRLPETREAALEELRNSLRDKNQALRRVHLALEFGIELDLVALEIRLNENTARTGGGTDDDALARFALALTQKTPEAVADYIDTHREQLYRFLRKEAVVAAEIEILARAKRSDRAAERLAEELAMGLEDAEGLRLQRIVSEAAGSDPMVERRIAFERSGTLVDLLILVRTLDEQKSWPTLLPYARQLFEQTRSVEDGLRVAACLNELRDHVELLTFLDNNSELVSRSVSLQALFAWTLYRDGQLWRARQVLNTLVAARDDADDRRLRLALAINSGEWDDLVEFTTDEWKAREQRTSTELLSAAELAHVMGGPHAVDLVKAAVEKAPDDAGILATAYFHATRAGWEDDAITTDWLRRAIALSGEDGPLKAVSTRARTHKRDFQGCAVVIQGLRKETVVGSRLFLADRCPVCAA